MRPWEKYQAQPADGPWNKYKAQPSEAVVPEQQFAPRDTGGFFETAVSDVPNPANITVDDVKQGASAVARPLLEGGGAVGGGMLGSATGNPVMTLLGAGGGYAIGANAADRFDEALGVKEPMSLQDIAVKSVTDIPVGAAFEAGGQVVAKALPPVMTAVKKAGKWVFEKTNAQSLLKHVTNPGAQREAAAILADNTTDGAVYVKNMEEANELMAEIPGLKLSQGQKTMDPGIIKLERVQMRTPGTAAGMVKDIEAGNVEALRKYYDAKLGGVETVDDAQRLLSNKKDLLESTAETMGAKADSQVKSLEPVLPQQTGKDLLENISAAEKPVKKAMGKLKKMTPEYPMEFTNTTEAIRKIKADKTIDPDVKQPIIDFQKAFDKMVSEGKSTFTATGIRRAINGRRSKLYKAGDKWAGDLLGDVKEGLIKDLEVVGSKARTGKIGEYKGRAVNPDELAGQLEKDSVRLSEMAAKNKPDVQAMRKALSDEGYPTMQVTMEGDAAYAERITRDYTRKIGKEVPYTSDKSQQKMINELKERIANNKEILSNVSPGQDVAASVKAYNDFASTEYFGRFDKGAVKLAKQRGAEAGGSRVPIEKIPNYFKTPSGADDLVKALGDKELAGGIMKGEYAFDMMQNATDPATGQVVAKKLASWYSKNKVVLKKYGIEGHFKDLKNATQTAEASTKAIKEFETSVAGKFLNADPEKAVANAIKGNSMGKAAQDLIDQIGDNPAAQRGMRRAFTDHIVTEAETTAKTIKNDPKSSLAAFSRLKKKYAPAIRVLFKDEPAKVKALNNMQRAYEMMARNASDPIGGGPETAGILLTSLGKSLSRTVTQMSRTARVIDFTVELLGKMGKARTNKVLNQVLFDPDSAAAMQKIIHGSVPEKEIEMVIKNKILKLADYRATKTAQAATVAGIMAKDGNDN